MDGSIIKHDGILREFFPELATYTLISTVHEYQRFSVYSAAAVVAWFVIRRLVVGIRPQSFSEPRFRADFFLSESQMTSFRRVISSNNLHRIGIAVTHVWIDFLSCSYVTGYDSFPDKLYADRSCVHTYPSLSYSDRLFTRV